MEPEQENKNDYRAGGEEETRGTQREQVSKTCTSLNMNLGRAA